MNDRIDEHVTIYQGNLSNETIQHAAIQIRDPSRGIHIQWIKRTKLGDHRVRIIAPNRALFNGIKAEFEKLKALPPMQPVKLKDVKKGEFIRRRKDAHKTYTKGDYIRGDKVYECNDWDDISRAVYLKGSTLVYVGFTF